MSLNWKEYSKHRFEIIQDNLQNLNSTNYPPSAAYRYAWAICIEPLTIDKDVIRGGHYIIRIYNDANIKKVDAPNPPFENGDGTLLEYLKNL